MSWVDRLLNRVLPQFFEHFDITKQELGQRALYLRRYYLFRKSWAPNFRIFMHYIARSDDDRHLYDHPWDFSTLILKGGYIEYLPKGKRNLALPGTVLHNEAEHIHRVELLHPTWTLLRVRAARREWGFHTERGWVDWRAYFGLPKETEPLAEDVSSASRY